MNPLTFKILYCLVLAIWVYFTALAVISYIVAIKHDDGNLSRTANVQLIVAVLFYALYDFMTLTQL